MVKHSAVIDSTATVGRAGVLRSGLSSQIAPSGDKHLSFVLKDIDKKTETGLGGRPLKSAAVDSEGALEHR